MPSRTQLETAAADVITLLKGIREYSNARIAVIGGLALWKYIPGGRTTEDVNFIINVSNALNGVKQKLLALPNTPFVQHAQFFYYQTPGGAYIQVDIVPEWQSPYLPSSAKKLSSIAEGEVPYISATDLIVFKINSCVMRAQASKKRTDAADAQNLLEKQTAYSALSLTSAQRAAVEPGIADVVEHGTKSEAWWRANLGLPAAR